MLQIDYLTLAESAPVSAELGESCTRLSDGEYCAYWPGDLRKVPVEVLTDMLAGMKARAIARGERPPQAGRLWCRRCEKVYPTEQLHHACPACGLRLNWSDAPRKTD
jgi:uncharacterized protein YbaR (Trm112 family)